jgi:hypothetical protein
MARIAKIGKWQPNVQIGLAANLARVAKVVTRT